MLLIPKRRGTAKDNRRVTVTEQLAPHISSANFNSEFPSDSSAKAVEYLTLESIANSNTPITSISLPLPTASEVLSPTLSTGQSNAVNTTSGNALSEENEEIFRWMSQPRMLKMIEPSNMLSFSLQNPSSEGGKLFYFTWRNPEKDNSSLDNGRLALCDAVCINIDSQKLELSVSIDETSLYAMRDTGALSTLIIQFVDEETMLKYYRGLQLFCSICPKRLASGPNTNIFTSSDNKIVVPGPLMPTAYDAVRDGGVKASCVEASVLSASEISNKSTYDTYPV